LDVILNGNNMKKLLFGLFVISHLLYSQCNSDPYIGKKLISINSQNEQIIDSLLQFNIVPFSCRGSLLQSELIVDDSLLNWLKEEDISFSIINNNVKLMIESEMNKIQNKQSERSVDWYTTYRDFSQIENKINNLVNKSYLAEKIIIGQSYEGRDITAVKISSNNDIDNKPSILINGCQHAREWITPMATVYLIEKLLQEYEVNDEINLFLDYVDVLIVPVVNPDGYVYTWEKDRWWRKNRQINSSNDCIGTDLNRNWDYDWNGDESTSEDPCSYVYVGDSPFSAPETFHLSQYISSIPNLVSHIDVHNYSSLIVGPWSSSDEITDDNDEIYCLGTQMQSAVSNTNNYPYIFGTGSVNNLLYFISGGMVDWVYSSFPALSFLYELRPASLYYYDSSFNGLEAFNNDEEEIEPTCEEFYNGVLEMIKWAYYDNCELMTGCSDPSADNYYCNTPEGNMGCLYNVDFYNPPQSNGAYTLLSYSLPLGFIDDGSCVYPVSLESSQDSKFISKKIDILGRETLSPGFTIIIYNDGTVEKIFTQ
tara:strand:- start:37320 stop:38933 length:1614 start_codon:yes stop_codon:yes gene_type:complete